MLTARIILNIRDAARKDPMGLSLDLHTEFDYTQTLHFTHQDADPGLEEEGAMELDAL